ncbi:hypothetical protein ACFFP0_14010 [Rhizobium puerariae]|uniref:Uncharacterized protein n=1 Tax=Rhizobium puerariae TaxID=1585791 RepID=A0ABV6AKV7_9HYPH
MWDIVLLILKWSFIVIGLSPIILAFGCVFIDGTIRPMLVPKAEIERMAADLISRHNDPEEAAAIEEHAAWYRSNNFEQGKWRRVRKLISLSKR